MWVHGLAYQLNHTKLIGGQSRYQIAYFDQIFCCRLKTRMVWCLIPRWITWITLCCRQCNNACYIATRVLFYNLQIRKKRRVLLFLQIVLRPFTTNNNIDIIFLLIWWQRFFLVEGHTVIHFFDSFSVKQNIIKPDHAQTQKYWRLVISFFFLSYRLWSVV